MPRDLVIGNGSLLIAFDSQYRLADLYYPRVGMENHAASRFHFGIWTDGCLHNIEDHSWSKSLSYLRDTLVTEVSCENRDLGLRIRCHDVVDPDANTYVRKISVRNFHTERREIKVFLHQALSLYGNPIGDTAMFDPTSNALIHYKANRYFLFSVATDNGSGVVEYACRKSVLGGAEGSWRDAEDGALSMMAVAQGTVDSTFGVPLGIDAGATSTMYTWICAGRNLAEVRQLDARLSDETPARMMSRSASYWYTWVNKGGDDLAELPDEVADLYRRSLLVISTQIDRGGAVLAANDSDIHWGHDDHYSYMWPRESAFVCDALDRAGYPEFARRFLRFASSIIGEEGYFLQKYNPDGSLASLWQPWIRDGRPQLPIAEDATALVVWLLARHYTRTRDLELTRELYTRLVVAPADFLLAYRDQQTGLPLPSFDLWEERQGVFLFTSCAVVAGLEAAAQMAGVLNDQDRGARYTEAAERLRQAIPRHFWLESEQRFARGYLLSGEQLALDLTVDASLCGAFYLGVFPTRSSMVEGTMRAIRERLWVQTEVGGVARYEGDAYHRISEEASTRVPGNPWLICTLWLAEYAIARGESPAGLQSALDLVRWARSKASQSLILPEQINPYDGTAQSVSPFTWSHAQVISVVQGYLKGLRAFRGQQRENLAAENGAKIDRANSVDNP